ncbi:hypothetical protein ACLOJK_016070 [Asimina triloba]
MFRASRPTAHGEEKSGGNRESKSFLSCKRRRRQRLLALGTPLEANKKASPVVDTSLLILSATAGSQRLPTSAMREIYM